MHPAMCNGITNTAVPPTLQGKMSPWGKATPIPRRGQRAGCVGVHTRTALPSSNGFKARVQLRQDLQPSPGKHQRTDGLSSSMKTSIIP